MDPRQNKVTDRKGIGKMFTIKGKYTEAKVMIDDVEPACMSQIQNFCNHPAFTNPIAIMPDCHYGSGSCIGFTMPMTEKVIPAVIGVDIGCGVLSLNIGKELLIPLNELDQKIRQRVPMGMSVHSRGVIHMGKEFPWRRVQESAHRFVLSYGEKFRTITPPVYDLEWFEQKCKVIGGNFNRMISSIGTLGSGNHYIDLGKDLKGDYWLSLHTGSRNFGKRICEYWQEIAAKRVQDSYRIKKDQEIEKVRSRYVGEELFQEIETIKKRYGGGIKVRGLEWLEGADAEGYLFDMIFAQTYAEVNREYIAKIILDILELPYLDRIETTHNLIDFQDMTIRKGAVRSYKQERFVLPLNMRDGHLICEGKSNPEWNCSAPHGAGRLMSRGKAKRKLSVEEFRGQMKGIYSSSISKGTLDEAPDAYKDSKMIERTVEPTAEVLDRVVPVLNIKATEAERG